MMYNRKRNGKYIDHYYYMTVDLERMRGKVTSKRRRTLTSEIRSGYKMLIAIVIVLNLVIGAAYFAINGQKTVLGYQLNELQLTNEQLKNEAKRIDHEIVNATAFSKIEKSAETREMVEAENMNYTIGSTRTAKQY